VIESPAGARVKLKYAPDLGGFILSRPLVLGVTYPFDWGFVPGTRAPDGDAGAARRCSSVAREVLEVQP
jgi:inorganic pyrophosphatase